MIAFWFEPYKRYIVDWNENATFNAYQMRNTQKVLVDTFTVYDVKSIDEAYKHAADWVKRSPV